jgi:hypothetical protein
MLCVPNRADLFNSAQIPGGGGKREVSEQEVPEQEVPEQECRNKRCLNKTIPEFYQIPLSFPVRP